MPLSPRPAAGTVGQVAYMKVYDPAFELAQREAKEMDDIRFVQVNHLHPDKRPACQPVSYSALRRSAPRRSSSDAGGP